MRGFKLETAKSGGVGSIEEPPTALKAIPLLGRSGSLLYLLPAGYDQAKCWQGLRNERVFREFLDSEVGRVRG